VSSLTSQLALVTGASSGIGYAISTALLEHGATVLLVARNEAGLTTAEQSLPTAAQKVEIHPCDITKDDEIEGLQRRIAETHNRLDILVHCAGVIDQGKLAEAPVTSLDRQYQVNVRGPLLLTQRLLPLLKKPKGQIVFVNSSAGLSARSSSGQYAATKHAFKAIADALREEVNSDGVRVLSVFPGRTATRLTAKLYAEEGRPYDPEVLLQPEDVASVVVHALSLPWTAEVTNISIRPMLKSY
jgi:NADP-dependent 3-hydroxy acid dehydrogenase YdfG